MSKILSSSLCEFFSVLVELTEEKRVNTEKSDDWIALQHFVAILRSNGDFSSMMLSKVGTFAYEIRKNRNEILIKRKNYQHSCRKLEKKYGQKKTLQATQKSFDGQG